MSQHISVLTDYFAERAAQSGSQAAYYSKSAGIWQSINWTDFHRRASVLASGLNAVGIEKGDVVGILAPTGLEWEVAQVGLLLCGATVVGLDAHDLPERLAQIVETSGIRALIVEDGKVFERLPERVYTRLDCIVSIAGDDAPKCLPTNSPLVDKGRWVALADLEDREHSALPVLASPDTVATIIFTSGSTGRPKGIPYTHQQVCLAIADILEAFPEIARGDRLVCWLPLSNLFQRMINFCAAGRGAETYFVSDPRKIIDVLPEIKPHLFISVPRFFEKLYDGIESKLASGSAISQKIASWALATGDQVASFERQRQQPGLWLALQYKLADKLVLSKLRQVMGGEVKFLVSGSAPLSRWLIERYHAMGLLVLEAYGLSENVTPIAINRVTDFAFGSVGKPMPSNEVKIAADGEVIVKGPGVFSGYLGDPKAEAAIDEDSYLHTGDLGEFDEQGFLKLVGRKSEMFKTSTGRKVAPVPIEAKLKRIPGIDYAVLVGAGRKVPVVILAPGMEIEKELSSDANFQAFAESVSAHVNEVLKDEQAYTRPSGAVILRRTFSIDTGELTSNLKLRRGVIEEMHNAALVALYDVLESSEQDLQRFDDQTILLILRG